MTDARTLPGCCQGCADTNFNREFSSTRAPSLHELRKEGLDTVSMPNARTCREMLIPRRMIPAGPIKSDQETIPRRVRLPATEPRQLLRTRTWCCCSGSPHFRCCLLRRIDDIGEKNCCQSSIRLGTGRIREKFLDPIEQRVRISHVWGMIRAGQFSQAVYS